MHVHYVHSYWGETLQLQLVWIKVYREFEETYNAHSYLGEDR